MMLVLRSVVLALVVFLAGYGALTVYWFAAPQPGTFRGFYDYPSAVWGDGLLLPLSAGALAYAIGHLPKPKQHLPAAAGAIIGCVIGGLVILGWVSDANPGLNWTMPAAGQLNEAGKWHAVFLVGASALFGTLWAEFLHRLRTASNATSTRLAAGSVLRSGPFAVILGTTFGYAFLAGHDSAQVGTTSAGASSLVALIGSAVFVVVALAWAARGDIRYAAASSLSGFFVAAGLSVIALNPPATIVSALLTGMAAAAGYSFAMTAEPLVQDERSTETLDMSTRGSPALEWVAVPALFAAVPLFGQHPITAGGLPTSAAVVVAVLVCVLVLRRFRRRTWDWEGDNRWFLVTALFLVVSYGVPVLLQGPNLAFLLRPILLTLTAAALSQIALIKCQADYARLMELEQSKARKSNDGLATLDELAEQKGIWGRLGGAGVAATLAIVTLTVSIAPDVGWLPATGQISLGPTSMILGAAAMMTFFWVFPQIVDASRRKSVLPKGSSPSPRAGSLPATCVACGLLIIAGLLPWLDVPAFHPIAALQAALIAVFVVESIVGNGVRLNLVRVGREAVVLGLLAGTAAFLTIYWALTKGVGSSNAPVDLASSLLANIGAILIVALITISATSTAYGLGRARYLTQYTPVSNAKQDIFLVSLLWLVLAWIPQTAAEHISREDPLHDLKVLGLVLSIIAVCGKTLLWITKNNDTHSGRERVKAGFDAPDYALPDAGFWRRTSALPVRIADYLGRTTVDRANNAARYDAIDGHTAVQNAVALALVCVTLVGALPAVYQLFEEYMQVKNSPSNTT
jgi:hypothetical protein